MTKNIVFIRSYREFNSLLSAIVCSFGPFVLVGLVVLAPRARAGQLGCEHALADLTNIAPFAAPNEPNPIDTQPLLTIAGTGVYAAVGSERVLFDYLLADDEKVKLLLALDMDAGIIHFHKLNSILLRLAPDGDLASYQKFRLQSSAGTWSTAAQLARANGRITANELRVILEPENLGWWQKLMADKHWASFNQAPVVRQDAFYGVNYLFDAKLLARLQTLALSGRYQALQIDLSEPQQLLALTAKIRATGHLLSFFDISNAWESNFPNNYLGTTDTSHLLEALDSVAQNRSIFMISLGRRAGTPMWYRGYTFGAFRRYLKQIDDWSNAPYTWYHGADHFQMEFLNIVHQVSRGEKPERSTLTSRF